jgi:Zn finger protein HypA/HybF involved in hydrogenase expression
MKNNWCKDQHHFKEIQSDITCGKNRIVCEECNSKKVTLDDGHSVIITTYIDNYDVTKYYER